MTDKECRSCHRQIDAAAKACPFCGADPDTGAKVELKSLVDSHFPPRAKLTQTERAAQFVRARQGVVITIVAAIGVLLLAGLYQFIAQRNQQQPDDVPPVPLTEISDASQSASQELPLPDLKFACDGNPRAMQTYLVEPGAVAPAAPAAAQPATAAKTK